MLVILTATEVLLRFADIGDVTVFEANPDYGYLMRPNQSVSPRGHRFHINHAGLRGAEFTATKQPGVFRIVFVGDSVTFGGGRIREEDLFVSRIAEMIRSGNQSPIDIINAGVPGWGIQNMA